MNDTYPDCKAAFEALGRAKKAFAAYTDGLEKLLSDYQKVQDSDPRFADDRWVKLALEEARHFDEEEAIGQALARANATVGRDRQADSDRLATLRAQYAFLVTTLGEEIVGLGDKLARVLEEVDRLRPRRA
jgi:hypothetical protein